VVAEMTETAVAAMTAMAAATAEMVVAGTTEMMVADNRDGDSWNDIDSGSKQQRWQQQK
jgi:hypothetical protein